jgi:dTDP-glucose 4,6-dehydratase
LLEAAREYWLNTQKWNTEQCRFHHISTDEVYGSLSATELAFTETTPYAPNSPYSASKAGSDHLVRAYFHTYGLPATMSNCSNNYGPRQHSEKMIPTVINACKTWQPIPVYGDGSNIRDWLHVQDHCEAIELILHKGIVGETYNIGGNNELNNLELVHLICDQMNKLYPKEKDYRSLITFVQDRAGHDWRYAIDCAKISRDLGWKPAIPFKESIEYLLMETVE